MLISLKSIIVIQKIITLTKILEIDYLNRKVQK